MGSHERTVNIVFVAHVHLTLDSTELNAPAGQKCKLSPKNDTCAYPSEKEEEKLLGNLIKYFLSTYYIVAEK